MQSRQKLVRLVQDGWSVSRACRELGVSRPTGYLWLGRSREDGIDGMREHSCRPLRIPGCTDGAIQEELLAFKQTRPNWGAKKIFAKLWPGGAPISLRTADRILKRHGLVVARNSGDPAIRFERESPNELWQMDFKAVDRSDYKAFSVLDDCSRFCLHFAPLADLKTVTTFRALWDLFGEYGLPERILADNGPPFGCTAAHGPTQLEAMLWLLDINTSHGRPYHPQTQGKVERFHRTAQEDIGLLLRLANQTDVVKAMADFRHDYNWERPHESLGQKVPGVAYSCSTRKRPNRMPVHEIPDGAISRKVDDEARIRYKGKQYRAGKGLVGQYVEIRMDKDGPALYFASRRFRALQEGKP